MNGFGLSEVRVRGYRTLSDVRLRPGALSALVGEAHAGKSNLLAAIRTLLDEGAPPLSPSDFAHGGIGQIRIDGRLGDGGAISLRAPADGPPERAGSAPVLFVSAALRSGPVVEPAAAERTGPAARAADLLIRTIADLTGPEGGPGEGSDAGPANALVRCIEMCCMEGLRGLVILIEEPELYLRPQAQRYLYRLLREAASSGNQIIYSTHAPAFLNVARLEELVLVERRQGRDTGVIQPEPLAPGEEFRAQSEFDAERSEVFLARAAVLVEGLTEKLALPFAFRALGHDPDREAISIVECGGKANIPLFAGICGAVGVPFVAVHDRDAPPGQAPSPAERALNELIAAAAGGDRTVVLEPDFEAVAGLGGRKNKPERAWERFRALGPGDIPVPLARAVELSVALARGERRD